MQKELQFTLSIIGILIIGGVLLHGMWTIRKNNKKQKKARFESRNWEPGFEQDNDYDDDEPIFDDVGVGRARVVISAKESNDDQDIRIAPLSQKINANGGSRSSTKPSGNVDEVSSLSDDFSDDLSDISPRHALGAIDDDEQLYEGDDKTIDTDPAKVAQSRQVHTDQPNDLGNTDGNKPAPVLVKKSDSPIYSNVVTQPKPEFSKPSMTSEDSFGSPPQFLMKKPHNSDQQNTSPNQHKQESPADTAGHSHINPSRNQTEPPDFSLNIQDGPAANKIPVPEGLKPSVEKELSFAEQAKRFVRRNKKTVAEKIRKEPVIDKSAADQMRMDFDQSEHNKASESIVTKTSDTKVQSNSQGDSAPSQGETDVLVLNVRASDNAPISGAALLPMLLTLGFKFGEHDIFHRHVNTNGKGPILFSLTNMFKPGVFDIDNIETFSTHGLSLFMMLPIEGDAQQVFNMMHNAARKLSDEFGCRILDGNKVGLSKQSLQQYVERIREFERRRISK